MQLTVQALLSVIAAMLAVGIAAFAWQYRDTSGVVELVLFNLAVGIWTAGNAAQHVATTLDGKLFWVNVQYVGIIFVPITVYLFACQFTSRKRWARGWRLAAVAAPLVLLLVLSWTNQYHHLVRTDAVELVERPGLLTETVDVLDRSGAWGPAFWGGWLYSQAVLFVSLALVFGRAIYQQRIFQRQTIAITVGAFVPWAGHILYITGYTRIESVVFFVVTGGAFVYAVLRYEMFELTPVARDAVMELLQEGVIIVNREGRVVDVNEAATAILDRKPPSVIGEDAETVFEEFPELHDCYRTESGDDVRIERDGRVHYYAVNYSTLDSGQRTELTAIVLHDITPLRTREQELSRQTEQFEVISETLSHDLRNPLNVASLSLEQARQNGDEAAFDRIEHAHDRMGNIIDDVLRLVGGDEATDVRPVDLQDVARDAWSTVDTADATLELVDDGAIATDYGQCLTLLENLYRNAVQHGGADVTVRVGLLEDGFYVEDDGPGIPESERETVFKHGYTNDEGTGFGLTIVERVVTQHGWDVTVTEGTAGGARFEFTGVALPGTANEAI